MASALHAVGCDGERRIQYRRCDLATRGGDYKTRNVAVEASDAASVLNWYRRLIELRRTVPALSEGDYQTLR